MTDKQIIIDDLMKQLNEKTVAIMLLRETLDRKEQECEELAYENYELNELFDRLKAENDELKKKCNIYTCGICGNKEDCNKLYKTLTEIKEIAITGLEGFCPKCSRKECEDNNCIETAIRDILQIISECE